MRPALDELLSTAQVARRLGVTPNWVRVLMSNGRLQSYQTANGRLVEPEEVARFAREWTPNQRAA